MDTPAAVAPRPPAWRTCLDIEGQDADHYLEYVNQALLDCVDGDAGRVLELGCATGMFGQMLKQRHPGAHVTGIEPGKAAAELAAARLDRVVCARVEDMDFGACGIAPGQFDLVIAGDVLEHLRNPWEALERVRPLLAARGRLVASIPNVRNLQVIASLIVGGRFEYAERGLFDVTHLRFFALDDITLMLEQTGYEVEACIFTMPAGYQKIYRDNLGKERVTLQVGRMTLTDITQRELMEFCTENWIIRARPRP
jgi:2-polyprenyl-3-methyl-5-hydroxy-6-metoxy-1,4-benzoquinol methylase